MAQSLILSSGSVLNGSPITFKIRPNYVSKKLYTGEVVYPSYHLVRLEITCGVSGGDYEVRKMSKPVLKESSGADNVVEIDISSELRSFRDSVLYSPVMASFPMVRFGVRAYDEYMIDGEVFPKVDSIDYCMETSKRLSTLFGYFPDVERMKSGGSLPVRRLTRRPTTSPHLAYVGETVAYSPDYSTDQLLEASASLSAPTLKTETLSAAGLHTVGPFSLYATQGSNRVCFRFINSYGVIESVSVPAPMQEKFSATKSSYVKTAVETFNSFSRSASFKRNNKETWLFMSDPLTSDWMRWYLHEFFMSEHVWVLLDDEWIPCSIDFDDDITFVDHSKQQMPCLNFSVDFDVYGRIPR